MIPAFLRPAASQRRRQAQKHRAPRLGAGLSQTAETTKLGKTMSGQGLLQEMSQGGGGREGLPAPPDLPERRLLRKVVQQLYEFLHEHHIHEVACQSRVTRLFRKQICHSASHFTLTTSSPSQASPARLDCSRVPM